MDLLLLALGLNNSEGQLSMGWGAGLKALQTIGITLRFAKPTFHLQKTFQSCHLTPDLLFCFPFPPPPRQSGSSGQSTGSESPLKHTGVSQQYAFLATHYASKKQLGTFLITQMFKLLNQAPGSDDWLKNQTKPNHYQK